MRNLLILALFLLLCSVAPAYAEDAAGPLQGLGSFGRGLTLTIVPANLLAALAVGIWSQQLGEKSVLLGPVGFLLFALIGAVLRFLGIDLPLQSLGPALTVVFMGLLIASNARFAPVLAGAIAGMIGLYHGIAAMHYFVTGPRISDFLFWPGFVLGNLILTSAGIGMVAIAAHAKSERPIRILGAFILLAGLILIVRITQNKLGITELNN